MRCLGGSDTLRPLICGSSPTRFLLLEPSTPSPTARAPLALPPSHCTLAFPPPPPDPAFLPPARLQPHDRKGSATRRHRRPRPRPCPPPAPHAKGGPRWGERGRALRDPQPELARAPRRPPRSPRAGSRMCAARGSPAPPPAPRAPPPSAPRRSAFPSLSRPPPFSCLEVAGQRELLQ